MLAWLKTLGVVSDGAPAVAEFTSMFAYNGLSDPSTVGYPSTVMPTSALA
jgi:hypothetical protein